MKLLRCQKISQNISKEGTLRGGSCLRDINKTFLIYKSIIIYRTCMRRAPAKPVRACTLRKLCPVSHVTFEAPLRTSHFTLLTALFTLHTAQANRPHTGGTFHRRLQPLYTEKHKVLLCSVKSHTALHQGHFFCDVLLCDVKSHTTLHQGISRSIPSAKSHP